MKTYNVQVYESTFEGLKDILLFKVESSQTNTGAIAFRDSIFKAIKDLAKFPHSGKKLNQNYRAKVVAGHWLVYEIDEANTTVYVSDIIDPQQLSRAGKFL
mgnify:CR=1 FL=1